MPIRLVIGPTEVGEGWIALRPSACPCCVGRVQLQIELARIVRDRRPRGVLIELADPDHLPALRRALGEWPLSDYVSL